MNTSPMPPPDSQGTLFGLAVADAGALLAGAVSILSALLNSPSRQQFLILFLVSSAVGFYFVMRETHRRKRAYALWFAGLVTGILILAWPQLSNALPAIVNGPGNADTDNYYIDVSVYADVHGQGNMSDLGRPLPGLKVTAHDQWGPAVPFFTDRSTGVAQVKVGSPGLEVIGVCNIYQTHYLSPRHNSPEDARKIRILVDPTLLPTCPR